MRKAWKRRRLLKPGPVMMLDPFAEPFSADKLAEMMADLDRVSARALAAAQRLIPK